MFRLTMERWDYNQLYDAGIKNDKLALLHKLNETNKVDMKTPHGVSQRKVVNMFRKLFFRESHGVHLNAV